MNRIFVFLAIFAVIDLAASIYLSTCARMDVPILSKAAQAACIASCSAQNCATGHCEKRRGRKTCVCTRCDDGGNVPFKGK